MLSLFSFSCSVIYLPPLYPIFTLLLLGRSTGNAQSNFLICLSLRINLISSLLYFLYQILSASCAREARERRESDNERARGWSTCTITLPRHPSVRPSTSQSPSHCPLIRIPFPRPSYLIKSRNFCALLYKVPPNLDRSCLSYSGLPTVSQHISV